jgi:hypothetical protein
MKKIHTDYVWDWKTMSPELKINQLNQFIVAADIELDKWRKNSSRYKGLIENIKEYQSELKKLLACNQN